MPLRVHELAKELKISTAALRSHLQDLNVKVKSHMSFVDDDVVSKIRRMYADQVAAIKKMESSRRQYHHGQKQSRSGQSPRNRKPKDPFHKQLDSIEKDIKREPSNQPYKQYNDNRRPDNRNDRQKSDGEQIRTFVEKPIKKKTGQRDSGFQKKTYNNDRGPRSNQGYSGRNTGGSGRPQSSRPKPDGFKKPFTPKPVPKTSFEKVTPPETDLSRKFGKGKKVDTKELGNKSKHLQAKIKHTTSKGKRKKKFVPTELEAAEITKNIRQTLKLSSSKKKKYKKDDKKTSDQNISKEIVISDFTSVSELAKIMNIQPTEIIAKFFSLGQMVTINQRLDKESLEMICDEFEFEVSFQEEYGTELLEKQIDLFEDVDEEERPPIVTIMGHVDHGKTSILDYIRNENVIAGESGGITQHIGAYQVEYNGKKISFIDTPGHEAFTAMRARGANITDIAIIVVAANDGVMPQTIEAIDHAKAAGVTLIIAINKVDLPDANVDRTIANLAEQKLFLEGYGGEVLWCQTSAVTGEGINDLLDTILLASEVEELKAKVDVPGKGVVIESRLDSRMGVIMTILLQEGMLKRGDSVVCGATFGKVRRMENERGSQIKEIGPSSVAVIYGMNSVPKAGDIINKVENEKTARSISSERKLIRSEREKYKSKTSLDNLFQKIKEHKMSEIKLIVKADTDGSMEALCDSFQKLSNEEVMIQIIHRSVGAVIEADVNLAAASDAIIIGFHVRANSQSIKLAEENGIEIKTYQIIYDAIQDLKHAIEGMLSPDIVTEHIGTAEVKQIFKIKKIGVIAGCAITKGHITSEADLKLFRNDALVYEGDISSLKHYNADVKEVKSGTECGIGIQNFNDIKEGDIIEAYVSKEVQRTLS